MSTPKLRLSYLKFAQFHSQPSKKSPTGPTERTPNPEYLNSSTNLLNRVRWDSVLFNCWWKPLYGNSYIPTNPLHEFDDHFLRSKGLDLNLVVPPSHGIFGKNAMNENLFLLRYLVGQIRNQTSPFQYSSLSNTLPATNIAPEKMPTINFQWLLLPVSKRIVIFFTHEYSCRFAGILHPP